MAEPFLSEIRIMGFSYAPKSWAQCNGQLLPINQNQALFALLGTTYGGNGQTTFALPDLRGRVPIHEGSGHILGEKGGEAAHTLTISELPTHAHVASASSVGGTQPIPTSNFLGGAAGMYNNAQQLVSLLPATIGNAGGSQAHQNMQPYIVLNFCIALQGIFPSQN